MHPHSSSPSCRTISTDIPEPFSPPFSIVHCFRQVFRATSHIGRELLHIGSCWLSCLCSSMWRDLNSWQCLYHPPRTNTVTYKMLSRITFKTAHYTLLILFLKLVQSGEKCLVELYLKQCLSLPCLSMEFSLFPPW